MRCENYCRSCVSWRWRRGWAAIGLRRRAPERRSSSSLNGAAPNPFGTYLPEILRAEGLNSFNVIDLAALNAGALTNVRLVVLAETALTGGQVTTLTNFVSGGGRLVAMNPDVALNGVLGIGNGAGGPPRTATR